MTEIETNCQFITVKITGKYDPKKPVPLRIKRDTKKPNCWETPDGKRIFNSEEWAIKAMEMDTPEYDAAMRKRIAAGRIVRAEVAEGYDGWVTVTGDEDDYAQDVEELLEKHSDRLSWADVPDEEIAGQLPAWAFCCQEDGFDFDLESQLDSYLDGNHHENARDWLVDEKELWEFWNAWVAKQNLRSYIIDYKRIVVIDQARYEAELAEAKAYLAEISK
ncbi:hypothetical protein G6K96_21750 [Agrobacterium vitis]|uniref:hypothetical protein n=1 Tax=Agrobacterium vitis TaxID=373 RepID=UPI00157165C3|nr:hypothetical protein [Agrobacterium vitis]NTA34360.1 hypothetical protein [Agrobacterium vitis]